MGGADGWRGGEGVGEAPSPPLGAGVRLGVVCLVLLDWSVECKYYLISSIFLVTLPLRANIKYLSLCLFESRVNMSSRVGWCG